MILSGLLAVMGIPSALANIPDWLQWLSNSNQLGFQLGFFLLALGLLLSMRTPKFLQMELRFARTSKLDLELHPSSGPSSNLVLAVKNKGETRAFSGQCKFLALRNSPNPLSRRTIQLKWENSDTKQITIEENASENLEVAKFILFNFAQNPTDRWAEISFEGLTSQGLQKFESNIWPRIPNEKPPEYDVEISIIGEGVSNPYIARFTVRAEKYSGPLEMIRLNDDDNNS